MSTATEARDAGEDCRHRRLGCWVPIMTTNICTSGRKTISSPNLTTTKSNYKHWAQQELLWNDDQANVEHVCVTNFPQILSVCVCGGCFGGVGFKCGSAFGFGLHCIASRWVLHKGLLFIYAPDKRNNPYKCIAQRSYCMYFPSACVMCVCLCVRVCAVPPTISEKL